MSTPAEASPAASGSCSGSASTTSRRSKGGGKGSKGGKGKPRWQVKSSSAADSGSPSASTNATTGDQGQPVPAPVWVELDGVPWPLLPCEVELEEELRALAVASASTSHQSSGGSTDAVLAVLRKHPFIEVKGPPGGRETPSLGDLGTCAEEHFRMNIRTFNKWLKTPEGKPFAKQAGGPADDGLYTVSAVLRRCMPRGLSRFVFPGAADLPAVVVRGFRKFTGLTAEDEDEESGATNMYENFYYAPDAPAARFTVTTKSNGENGKFTARRVGDQIVFFAGSKNTCLPWRETDDVRMVHPPQEDGAVPGPVIASMMQDFWRGFTEDQQKTFVEQVSSHCWTLMLEINCASHEHIFPIEKDFVEFVAILDQEGVPLPQKQAFAFFDQYKLPRVHCEEGLLITELASRLSGERMATDREGAVLYLETEAGATVGLLKVKSNFYVRARRTRQTFWSTIADPLLRNESFEEAATEPKPPGGKRPTTGWAAAERRLVAGMKELMHVEGCADNWEAWAETAVGFVRWWRQQYESLNTNEEKHVFAKTSKAKFGSQYRDYCKSASLPGGEN